MLRWYLDCFCTNGTKLVPFEWYFLILPSRHGSPYGVAPALAVRVMYIALHHIKEAHTSFFHMPVLPI